MKITRKGTSPRVEYSYLPVVSYSSFSVVLVTNVLLQLYIEQLKIVSRYIPLDSHYMRNTFNQSCRT